MTRLPPLRRFLSEGRCLKIPANNILVVGVITGPIVTLAIFISMVIYTKGTNDRPVTINPDHIVGDFKIYKIENDSILLIESGRTIQKLHSDSIEIILRHYWPSIVTGSNENVLLYCIINKTDSVNRITIRLFEAAELIGFNGKQIDSCSICFKDPSFPVCTFDKDYPRLDICCGTDTIAYYNMKLHAISHSGVQMDDSCN
jgi:hypothetical protein